MNGIARTRLRLTALATALVLPLGISACGGDSNDDGEQEADRPATSQVDKAKTSTGTKADQKQIAALMVRLRNRYNATDGKTFCDNLTQGGVRELHTWSRTMPKLPQACSAFVTAYAKLFVAGGKNPQTPVRIKAISVNRDAGQVTMKGGLAGIRSTATYKVAKVGGDWKLTNPVSGAETRTLPKTADSPN